MENTFVKNLLAVRQNSNKKEDKEEEYLIAKLFAKLLPCTQTQLVIPL